MRNRIEFAVDRFYDLHGYHLQPNDIKTNENNTYLQGIKQDITEDMLLNGLNEKELLIMAKEYEEKYKNSENRYQKIEAAIILSRIYGYYLPNCGEFISVGTIPYPVIKKFEDQNYDGALEELYSTIGSGKPLSEAMMKIFGLLYWRKAFSIIEEQVRVCFTKRYPLLFNINGIGEYFLRNPVYYRDNVEQVLMPARIELTSCVGSDIFYLAMNRPEKARCINISVNLFDSVNKRMAPPISVIVRPTGEKGIRFTSVDLGCSKLVTDMDDLFNMRNDDLSLLKAAVIVSGIIPPGMKVCNNDVTLLQVLDRFMNENAEYDGFEVISRVIDIPRGSGLAVSTNLLAGLILALMRFSGQIKNHDDKVSEEDKMEVAARCIYGEWLGGSGGGWQDYGGMWGGIKRITGQTADSRLDPDSLGSLLPKYEEIHLNKEAVNGLLSSLVLVNGGTGQDVGPVLRMITENFILKEKNSWHARLRTESRFDDILEALIKGDTKRSGELENEDFQDRRIISPLSDNLYHQKTYEKLKSIFNEDLWGYDSTGGRAGAGGIFFINPEKRKNFENSFIEVCTEVQKKMEGQMHFSSKPLVYGFEINNEGVKVNSLKKHDAEKIVDEWLKTKTLDRKKNSTEHDNVDNIKKKCGFDSNFFENIQKSYKNGELSIKENNSFGADEIKRITLDRLSPDVYTMPSFEEEKYNEMFNAGKIKLKEPFAYIVLNGGESTRYGVNTIKGLSPVFYLSGKYCSMIELKMRHLNFIQKKYECPLNVVFVNSYFTNNHTVRILEDNNHFGVPSENIYHSMHQVIHRVNPSIADLEFWYEVLREKGLNQKEENLAKQYMDSMKKWILEKGEGNIYESPGVNKLSTLVSPGHFYSFISIVSDYTLGHLIEKGVRRLLISSNDNLLSTVDPAVLAFHTGNERGVTAEIVPRLYDRGGAPVLINGKVVLLEDFSFPDQSTLWNMPFFNPITTWMEVDELLKLLELNGDDLIDAAHGDFEKQKKCYDAVCVLAGKLKTYVVLKNISEDMGNGVTYTFPVIQFEKLYGDLVGLLNPVFLAVPKVLRHTQMKSVEHVYQIMTDRALDVLRPQIVI